MLINQNPYRGRVPILERVLEHWLADESRLVAASAIADQKE